MAFTFGKTSVTAISPVTNFPSSQSTISVCQFQGLDQNMLLHKITVRSSMINTSTSSSIKGVIYNEGSGFPSILLGITAVGSVAANDWVDLPFIPNIPISSVANYWLGIVANGINITSSSTIGANLPGKLNYLSDQSIDMFTSPPLSFPSVNAISSSQKDIYATYTPYWEAGIK